MLKVKNEQNKQGIFLPIFLAVVASLCIMIASSGFWFNKYIFDTHQFTSIATSSLFSQSSRNAMASEITDRILKNRPLLQGIIDEQVVSLISGLLDSPRAKKLMEQTVIKLQTTITSENPQSTVLDLTSIKATLGILAAIGNRINPPEGEEAESTGPDLQSIPDSIVLIDVQKLPNIYQLGMTLNWLAPLALIIALASLALPIYKAYGNKELLSRTLFIDGLVITVGAFVSFMIGPLFKPQILSQVNSINMRIVAANLYDAFNETYTELTMLILVLGIIFLLAAAAVRYIPYKNRD